VWSDRNLEIETEFENILMHESLAQMGSFGSKETKGRSLLEFENYLIPHKKQQDLVMLMVQ
jgi:hypothetical protein